MWEIISVGSRRSAAACPWWLRSKQWASPTRGSALERCASVSSLFAVLSLCFSFLLPEYIQQPFPRLCQAKGSLIKKGHLSTTKKKTPQTKAVPVMFVYSNKALGSCTNIICARFGRGEKKINIKASYSVEKAPHVAERWCPKVPAAISRKTPTSRRQPLWPIDIYLAHSKCDFVWYLKSGGTGH